MVIAELLDQFQSLLETLGELRQLLLLHHDHSVGLHHFPQLIPRHQGYFLIEDLLEVAQDTLNQLIANHRENRVLSANEVRLPVTHHLDDYFIESGVIFVELEFTQHLVLHLGQQFLFFLLLLLH